MNPRRWQRLRDIFEHALDKNPTDAVAWVNAEAADDTELRQEILALLDSHERGAAFLSEPAGFPLDDVFGANDVEAEQADVLLTSGQQVGPYVIVREAGQGGMARVYVATDTRLNRTVALKSVHARLLQNPAQRERLQREARSAAALVHPGICTVYALEEIGGQLYMAVEYVEGRTLRQEMRTVTRPLPETIVDTMKQLADALACAHDAGIAHGDLKPENVMRTLDGRLKILDFGLARVQPDVATPRSPTLTQEGMLIGTPGYMAPEQLTGHSRDPQTDVFALGVLMYEFATGVHPFAAATSLAIAARVLSETPPGLTTLRPDLSQRFAAVVDRCLLKLREGRFSTAAEVRRVLQSRAQAGKRTAVAAWWRIHQIAVLALYFGASLGAWKMKEEWTGVTTPLFLIIGIVATVAGVFRAHLLFTERVNAPGFEAERRRAQPITMASDIVLALALIGDGASVAAGSPVIALLSIALGIGIALVRLVIEPATTAAAFEHASR
jgi:tRNA A-37 threonylcarbamoyl transferase component Bud32